jgi:uncharacterized linocin/CFP29 family protein
MDLLSKHPLELPPKRELSKEEITEAIRLNAIAELDAVNLYEQLANYIQDENVKKVFLDIAKEEKTHVGEFLALLKSYDPEQASELLAGAKEVEALTGIKTNGDPADAKEVVKNGSNSDILGMIRSKVLEGTKGLRYFRGVIPVISLGRGTEFVQVVEGEELKFSQLQEIESIFSVKLRELEFWKKTGIAPELASAVRAGMKLAKLEDELILKGSEKGNVKGLLTCSSSPRIAMGDWNRPSAGLEDAVSALALLSSNGAPRPYALLLSPADYAKLVKFTEHTGVSELKRIEELFNRVLMVPSLPEGKSLALSASSAVADIVFGGDTEVDEIGPRNGEIEYRAWETLLLRIKMPEGIVILERK